MGGSHERSSTTRRHFSILNPPPIERLAKELRAMARPNESSKEYPIARIPHPIRLSANRTGFCH
jgi:hypothetical protein